MARTQAWGLKPSCCFFRFFQFRVSALSSVFCCFHLAPPPPHTAAPPAPDSGEGVDLVISGGGLYLHRALKPFSHGFLVFTLILPALFSLQRGDLFYRSLSRHDDQRRSQQCDNDHRTGEKPITFFLAAGHGEAFRRNTSVLAISHP
jgi:hypothetical protein